jgi:acetyl-CoA/propionyl-CoA carboxylase biotin carboxyl carrier protein
MNTRIQVEHTISEMVSGIDLIREQLRVAAGEPLGYGQDAIDLRGHAIEVRVNAEDPAADFRPAPGTLSAYREPAGFGVRVDSAASPGFVVKGDYDSMIAKLIVAAPTREQAFARLRRAIDDYAIAGVPTTLPFLRALIDAPAVVDGTYGTATLERFARTYEAPPAASVVEVPAGGPPTESDTVRVEVNDRLFVVRLLDEGLRARSAPARRAVPPRASSSPSRNGPAHDQRAGVLAPMHGVVVEIATEGQAVREGDVIAVIEAMKMMNEIHAQRAGTVARVLVERGTTVEAQTPLLQFAEDDA